MSFSWSRLSAFLLVILGLFLLTGCKPGSSSDPAALVSAPKLTCNDLIIQIYKQECIQRTETQISESLQREITETFDRGRCAQLMPPERVQSCQSFIDSSGVKGPISENDLRGFQQAQSEENKLKCEGIKNNSYQTYCVTFIEKIASQKLFREILSSQDKNRCKELKEKELAQRCLERLMPPPL